MFRYEGLKKEAINILIQGKSIRKTLMKTPIDGARLSFKVWKKKTFVLGYTKMHILVDFAAKTGTPIYAAGDGLIERANTFMEVMENILELDIIQIYKTAYAHLHKFAKKIKKGFSVKQGQIIGYVGSWKIYRSSSTL